MLKKLTLLLAVFTLSLTLFLLFFDFTWLPDRALPYLLEYKCPFDDEAILSKQQITETRLMRVLFNNRPTASGAILILPKRHVERMEDLTPEEWLEAHELIKRFQKQFAKAYGKEDYVLIVQNGYWGGQTVPHAHFHMIPRGKESTLMKKIEIWNVALTDSLGIRPTLTDEEIQQEIKRLQWDKK